MDFIIRKYTPSDLRRLTEIFYNTVHTVNRKDYSEEQLFAWADGNADRDIWNKSFLRHNTYVAQWDGETVGFCDMDGDGYLDRLYVHHLYIGKGIGRALVQKAEEESGLNSFYTYASVTAKGFFEKMGYKTVRENTVNRRGIRLKNYLMKKNV